MLHNVQRSDFHDLFNNLFWWKGAKHLKQRVTLHFDKCKVGFPLHGLFWHHSCSCYLRITWLFLLNLTSSWIVIDPEVLHFLPDGFFFQNFKYNKYISLLEFNKFMRSFLSLFTNMWIIYAHINYLSEQRPIPFFYL